MNSNSYITNNYDKHWNCMINGNESYLYKLYGSFWGLYLTSDINLIECKYNYLGIYKNIRRFISTKMLVSLVFLLIFDFLIFFLFFYIWSYIGRKIPYLYLNSNK